MYCVHRPFCAADSPKGRDKVDHFLYIEEIFLYSETGVHFALPYARSVNSISRTGEVKSIIIVNILYKAIITVNNF
jgi:hypothetical protein